MAQRVSGYLRQKNDVYETPPWVAHVVARHLRNVSCHAWDPANGPRSKLASAFRDAGLRALATDDDFLKRRSLPSGIDCIATNPPYGAQGRLACQFIAHALDLEPAAVAMLLPIDFDSAKTRTYLFRDCQTFTGKIVLLNRIVWFERPGADGPSTNHAWYLWSCPKPCGVPPAIIYEGKPDADLLDNGHLDRQRLKRSRVAPASKAAAQAASPEMHRCNRTE